MGFTKRQAKNLHKQKYCKKKDQQPQNNNTDNSNNNNTDNSNSHNNNDNIKNSNDNVVINNSDHNNINNAKESYNTINSNNTTYITINAFGKERLDKLTPTEIKHLIKNNNPLIDIIELLNFNINSPENHSFCNTSLEGHYVSILNTDKNKVEKVNKNDFYDKVLNNSFDKIDQLSVMLELDDNLKDTLKDKYKKHLDKKIHDLRDNIFTDKVYKNCYKKNINQMAYNNKKIVLNTWSTIKETHDDDNDSISTLATELSDDTLLTDDEI